jgi:RHS repeat-associated protein
MARPLTLVGSVAALLLSAAAHAQAPFTDRLVQPPKLAAPERGSIKGTLSNLGFSASQLSRGTFSLPLPISTPSERGPLQADVVPSYSPDRGLSEWGMGWGADLEIKRAPLTGDVDFQADDLVSPWGRLKKGNDGFFYPAGLASAIRLAKVPRTTTSRVLTAVDVVVARALGGALAPPNDYDWVATAFDGTEYRFSAAAGVTAPGGNFSWCLVEVRNLSGDLTSLSWRKNASGRPFLDRVRWGGGSGVQQYDLALTYQPVTAAFFDHAAGVELALDQRVSVATLSARDPASGAMRERWRDTVTYQSAPFGPAFYLRTVQRTFASGQTEPAMSYNYQLESTRLPLSQLQRYDGLDAVLAAFGDNVLQPDHGALHDVDNDGRPDLERAADLTLVKHGDAGWTSSALPPAAGAHPNCRPLSDAANPARTLTRMTADVGEPQVVVAQLVSTEPLTTQLLVCDRLGHPVADLALAEDWALGPNVRLVDIDRDRRPDIVRVSSVGVDILHNQSDAQGIRFTALPRFDWTFDAAPEVSWLHDFDGDGNLDIVLRSSSSYYVFYGLGRSRWTTTPRAFQVINEWGEPLNELARYQTSFVDANKDGLTDLLLSQDLNTWLFTNRGASFQEVPVSGFRSVAAEFGLPIVADLTGRGNTEVAFPSTGTTYFVELASAGTGLMDSASDGMGTVARFTYARSKPVPGFETRLTVLDKLTLESSGQDPVETTYAYGAPVAHTVSRQLVGFSSAQRTSPKLIEQVDFLNSDDVGGLVAHTRAIDADSPLVRFSDSVYQPAAIAGVPFLRMITATTGTRRGDGTAAISSTTSYEAFARDHCPTRVRTETGDGTLTTESTLAELPALAGLPHCTVAATTLRGTHPRPELDFTYDAVIDRNAIGQPTRLRQVTPGAELVLQDVTYDAAHRPITISQPGQGAVTLRWDATTNLLREVVAADGVVTTSRERDPLTDGLRELGVDRGAAPWVSWFRYDGQERLWRSWDDLGVASEAAPATELTYAFAGAATPGRVHARTMLAPGSHRETVDLSAANGETLATLARSPAGWRVGGLRTVHPAQLESRSYWRAPLATSDLGALDWPTLRAGATQLGRQVTNGAGRSTLEETTLGTGVNRRVDHSEAIVGAAVVSTALENNAITTQLATDALGRVRWHKDGAGYVTALAYDALGRLVGVTLPDGAQQSLTYDAFGRPAVMTRPGVTSVHYLYKALTGMARRKEIYDGEGQLERAVEWTRDSIGRVVRELHTQPRRAATREVAYHYDGQLDGAVVAGQRGQLSEVVGEGFVRRTRFGRDARPLSTTLKLADWRTLEQSWTRYEDGSIKDETLVVRDGKGQELSRLLQTHVYDAWGRLAAVQVNGAPFATLFYDVEGRLDHVNLPGGAVLVQRYEPLTHAQNGYWIDAGTWSSGIEWRHNNRGLIGNEDLTVGQEIWEHAYEYDARGLLTRSSDEVSETRSSYGPSALPTSMTDQLGHRAITRTSRSIQTGAAMSERYGLDSSGRVISHGDLALTWGPTGEIDTASRGARTWSYLYDDAGQRIAKRENGAMVAGYVGSVYVTSERTVVPVKLNGRLIGTWELASTGNHFELVATDPRGTLVADRGVPNLASPYGVRTQRPSQSAALDYVERGYDADLGTVRFGVRDYDPLLGQFWSPDPAFLDSLDKCAASPLECNLYGYAGGNPLNHIDPSGLGWKDFVAGVCGAVVGALDAVTFDQYSKIAFDQGDLEQWHTVETFHRSYVAGEVTTSVAMMAVGVGEIKAGLQGAAAVANGYKMARGGAAIITGGAALVQEGRVAVGAATVVAASVGISLSISKSSDDVGGESGSPQEQAPARPLTSKEVTAGMEIDPSQVRVFRGGNSFKLKPGEVKIDPTTGMVKPSRGLSLDINPDNLARFGGARQITSVPNDLKIVQVGNRLEHFEVVPRLPMPESRFQELLGQIK